MATLVIDARMLRASGIGTYLYNLIPYLTKSFDVSLLGNAQEITDSQILSACKVINATSKIYTLKEQIEFCRVIPACDLFWSPHYNVPLLPIPAKKRIVTIHDTYHLAYQHKLSLSQKIYANILMRSAARASDKIITVSDFSKKELQKYLRLPNENIDVIHNGLDTEVYNQVDKNIARASLHQHIPGFPEGKFILFVGNVKPHKNLSTLVKAFSRLVSNSNEEYSLVIVGKKDGFITDDKAFFQMLKSNSMLDNQLFFTGHVSEEHLQFLYNSAFLFVFPSHYEGFGLPPLEAMACGCPVIASNVASIPEVCGDAAVYFSPTNDFALEEQMRRALTDLDLRERMKANGFRQIKKYSWQRAAAQHQHAFESLLIK